MVLGLLFTSKENENPAERFHRFIRKKRTDTMKTGNASFGSIKNLTHLEEDILDKDGSLDLFETYSFLDKSYAKIKSEADSLERKQRKQRKLVFNYISKEQQLYESTNSDFTYDSYNLEQDAQRIGESVFQEKEKNEFTVSVPAVREKNALPKDAQDYHETDIAQYASYNDYHAKRRGEECVVRFHKGKTWSFINPLKTFRVNPFKPLRKGNILSYLSKTKLMLFTILLVFIELVEIVVILNVLENIWGYKGWNLALYAAIPLAIGVSTFFGLIKRVEHWLHSDINDFKKVKFPTFLAGLGIVLALCFGLVNADFHRMEDASLEGNSITETTRPDFATSQNPVEISESDEPTTYYPWAKEIFYPLLSMFLAFSVGFISCVVLVFSQVIGTLNTLKKSEQEIEYIEELHEYKRLALEKLLNNTTVILHLLGEFNYYDEITTCPHTLEEIQRILQKKHY